MELLGVWVRLPHPSSPPYCFTRRSTHGGRGGGGEGEHQVQGPVQVVHRTSNPASPKPPHSIPHPSTHAQAEREIKYKSERKFWEEQHKELVARVAALTAEMEAYRGTSKAQQLEERIQVGAGWGAGWRAWAWCSLSEPGNLQGAAAGKAHPGGWGNNGLVGGLGCGVTFRPICCLSKLPCSQLLPNTAPHLPVAGAGGSAGAVGS